MSDSDVLQQTHTPAPAAREMPTGSLATEEGDDIYLDPPVRLLAQYDERWWDRRIGGPADSPIKLNWRDNGCNASCVAMVLRWFAEDCTAGNIEFPTKEESAFPADWYPLRMAEAFWPLANPPGKVELTPHEGHIHIVKLYNVGAHYLKTGDVERKDGGNVVDPSEPIAQWVTRRPAEGWMERIRALLAMGPVIVGIGAPADHFVLAHGIVGGGLLVADPGAVLYNAHHGGKPKIEDWSSKDGYLDGTMDGDQVRLPPTSQWPDGDPQGQDRDARSYHLISGEFLDDMLAELKSLVSLSDPEGAQITSREMPAPPGMAR